MRFPSIHFRNNEAGHFRARLILAAIIAALATLAAAPRAARGEEVAVPAADVRKARELYKQGDEAFRAGRFEEAHRHWQQGYALSGRPLFLVNMGHAERRRGDLASARALYQRYLLVEPDSKLRADVEAVVKEIDETLATAPASETPPATTSAPQPPLQLLPTAPPPAPPDPAAALLVRSSRDSSPDSAASPPPIYRRWWFWAGAGGAVAVGLASAVLVIRSSGDGPARSGSIGTLGTAE